MTDTSRIIHAPINNGRRYGITSPITQYDYGYLLLPEGVELPTTYEIDFSNDEKHGTSFTVYGNSEGAEVPEVLIRTGKDVYAFYYHVGDGFGRTEFTWRIPNHCRPDRDGETPTPSQQSSIDQLIVRSNEAVTSAEQSASAADQSAQSAQEYAEQAETAKSDAQTFAQRSANSAQASADYSASAQASATASAQSASQSAQIKTDVEDLADDAQASASASAQSASASANSASQASGYAQSASASAQSASGYASQAQTSAQTASSKATEASGYASTASAKATESAQSATNAQGYAQTAESAKVASQTAQGLAESARDSAVSAKTDAESARDDAVQAKEDAESAVASISGALDDKAPIITDTASGSIASFPDGADGIPLKSLVVDINPVQDLHGQESPYPAGGGKNLLPYATIESPLTKSGITFVRNQDGSIAANGTSTASFAQTFVNFALQPGSYYFNCGNGFSMQPNIFVYIRDMDNNRTLAEINVNSIDIDKPFSIDVQTNVRFYMVFGQTGLVISGTLYPMIRLASVSDATYAPYENICPISGWTQVEVNHSNADMTNPTTITIPLGQTVYGGKLDVLRGELTVYPYYASYNGETLTGEWISDRDKYVAGTTPTIGAQVVNIGAQGVTVQLSANQLNSLYGQNNLWADSGDTTAEYRADTKLFIERLTAPVSADMVADANITSGKYFMVGNTLYKATANIANGAQIIVGTNCIRKSLSEALNEINV